MIALEAFLMWSIKKSETSTVTKAFTSVQGRIIISLNNSEETMEQKLVYGGSQ